MGNFTFLASVSASLKRRIILRILGNLGEAWTPLLKFS